MAEATQPMERLQEYATNQGATLKVDLEKGVIPGVKILALQSKNDGGTRVYDAAAVARAIPKYEGAKVNVDHVKDGQSVSYRSRMGKLRNVRAEADALFADFHFNPRHALAEQLCWDAEHAPENVGFSHEILGRKVHRDGREIVEEIGRVLSVDLVANPATTNGLFEDEEAMLESDPDLKRIAEHAMSAWADARSIVFLPGEAVPQKRQRLSELLDTWQRDLAGEIADKVAADEECQKLCKVCNAAIDMVRSAMWDSATLVAAQAKRTRILQLLADWQETLKTNSTSENQKESIDMEFKDITVEQLKEHRQDLVAQLTGTDETSKLQAECKSLRESLEASNAKLAAIETEKAALAKQQAISEELKLAKLDASDKTACSEAFMETLAAAPDAAGRKRLIEDRVALLNLAKRSPISTGAPFAADGGDTGTATRDSLSGLLDG